MHPSQDLTNENGIRVTDIVEEFANDHDTWAQQFLEAWERMQNTGYTETELVVGPDSSWMGFYPLKEMGAVFRKFQLSPSIT